MTFAHTTVLLGETVQALAPVDGQVYVDCTLGGGGHTEALLQAADCRVIGLDRDPAALDAASKRLAPFGKRFTPLHSRFSELDRVLEGLGLHTVDGICADLGVSSPQLDEAARGFSFRSAGPVDMRMDPTAPLSAADLVNDWAEADLADVIWRYGEERRSRQVARAIVAGRPWLDTLTLAEAVGRAVGGKPGRIHPATRTFQALRIAVNDELGEIERLLPQAVAHLRPGGRLAVITFHSLEDRIVKHFLAEASGRNAPRDPWGNAIGTPQLTKVGSVTPASDDPNPRARSARLRYATRL